MWKNVLVPLLTCFDLINACIQHSALCAFNVVMVRLLSVPLFQVPSVCDLYAVSLSRRWVVKEKVQSKRWGQQVSSPLGLLLELLSMLEFTHTRTQTEETSVPCLNEWLVHHITSSKRVGCVAYVCAPAPCFQVCLSVNPPQSVIVWLLPKFLSFCVCALVLYYLLIVADNCSLPFSHSLPVHIYSSLAVFSTKNEIILNAMPFLWVCVCVYLLCNTTQYWLKMPK